MLKYYYNWTPWPQQPLYAQVGSWPASFIPYTSPSHIFVCILRTTVNLLIANGDEV